MHLKKVIEPRKYKTLIKKVIHESSNTNIEYIKFQVKFKLKETQTNL